MQRLAEIIDEGELRGQLDHARDIRFSKKELIWLAGEYVLRQDPDVLARLHQLARHVPPPEYELEQGGRPI